MLPFAGPRWHCQRELPEGRQQLRNAPPSPSVEPAWRKRLLGGKTPAPFPIARSRRRYRLHGLTVRLLSHACPPPKPPAAPSLPHRSARRQADTARSAGKENRDFSLELPRPWSEPPQGGSGRDTRRRGSHNLYQLV